MNMKLLGASCALAMTTIFGPTYAAVTFDSNYLDVVAVASASSVDTNQGGYEEIPGVGGGVSYFQNPATAEADASYTVSDGVAVQATATDDEVVTESLTGSSSGIINFNGSTSSSVTDSSAQALAYQGGAQAELYFDVSAPAIFSLSYKFKDSSQDGFSDTYDIFDLTDSSYSISSSNLINTSGATSYQLMSGSYELYLEESSAEYYGYHSNDLVLQEGVGSQTGSHNDAFSFSISGAPEPSTWALMIAGVGLVGGALRYRRHGSVLSAA